MMNEHNLLLIISTLSGAIMFTLLMGLSAVCFRCCCSDDGMPFIAKAFMGIIGAMGICLSISGFMLFFVNLSRNLL
jgi:hypothetical protein